MKVVDLMGNSIASPGHPDPYVVKDLEDLLDMAKEGRITGIAFSAVYHDNSSSNSYTGVISRSMLGGLVMMTQRIVQQLNDA